MSWVLGVRTDCAHLSWPRMDAHGPTILSRIASRSATLPGRPGALACSRLRDRRGCGVPARGSGVLVRASDPLVDGAIPDDPPAADRRCLQLTARITRRTVRCSHRASSATSWTVRYALLTVPYRLRRTVLLRTVAAQNRPNKQRPAHIRSRETRAEVRCPHTSIATTIASRGR
jgi:hypothetical protein